MSNPIITAALLIEANGAALNNSGEPIEKARTDNTVSVKSIRVGNRKYPYVSGQAWRRWWRELFIVILDGNLARPRAKSAYTDADPVKYADDDLFGYMAAKKVDKKDPESGGTFKRISPLKNSLLVSVLPNTIEQDFAHLSRNLPENFTSDAIDIKINNDKIAFLNSTERKKRIIDCLNALSRLRYGANLTKNLSDVTPVAVIIGFVDGGNAPFQKLFISSDDGGVKVDIDRLKVVINDYKDRFLSEEKVVFGCLPNVIENEEAVRNLSEVIYAGSAVDAIRKVTQELEKGNLLNDNWK